MIRTFQILVCALAVVLVSCGDDHLIEDNHVLKQYVLVAPDGFSGDISNYYDPIDELYVEQGQTLKFYAGYSTGGLIYTDETLQQYYSSLLWKIGDQSFNLNSFRYTFLNAGELEGSLESTDIFGDTLHTSFKIFVNRPNGISLEFPYNGYNQADPSEDQALPLRWSVTGIDPWETAICKVYMAYDQDSVWDNPLGSTDCNTEATLRGSLVTAYDSVLQQAVNLYDSSFTLYWGVKMLVKSESGREYHDSTDIFHFSTKILNKTSTIKIPIVYDRYRDESILQTVAYLISNSGDTLHILTSDRYSNTLTAKVEPQLGLKILLHEMNRLEYTSESLVVDVPAYTVLTTDTVFFKDDIPPQISPTYTTIEEFGDIYFNVYDNGSGINPAKLQVLVDYDTVQSFYTTPVLAFYSHCYSKCRIDILGEDYSRNKLPDVHWFIEDRSNYHFISGPFPNGEF